MFDRFKKYLNSQRRKLPKGYLVNAIPVTREEWIKIVPIGEFPEHPWGPHTISKADIESMAANFAADGTDLLFDYEHQSLWGSNIAAGWSHEVEARKDGLYCKYPEFVPAAQEMIQNREYRYFSPVYKLDAFDKKNHSIGAIINSVGLTNIPYMDTEIDHIGNSKTEDTQMELLEQIKKAFGFSSDASDKDIMEKVNSAADAAPEAGGGDPTTPAGSEEQTEEGTKVNSDIVTRLDAVEKAQSDAAVAAQNQVAEALVNSAIADGKILPADKDVYLNSAKADFEGTKTRLDAIKKNTAMPRGVNTPEASQGDQKVNSMQAATDFFKTQGRTPLTN